MELQLPLIAFTTLIAWSAGLFAMQCVYALEGADAKVQKPAWICAAVLLVVGGIAVFFHLQHFERIFNGFGHITSGITIELIAIVVLAIVAVVYLAVMRKQQGQVPSWLAVVGIVVAALLVCVCGFSYEMPSRPAWNNPVQILSLVGAAFGMGSATMMAFYGAQESATDQGKKKAAILATIGCGVNATIVIIYLLVMAGALGSIESVGYYFDPINPTSGMRSISGPLAAGNIGYSVAAIVGALAACAVVWFGKKNLKTFGLLGAVCVLISAICLRVVFYQVGYSAFTIF